jgi:hypothetical protein
VEVLGGDRSSGAEFIDARVVDEYVYPTERLLCFGRHARYFRMIGDIRFDSERLAAVADDFGDDAIGPLLCWSCS